MNVKDLELLGKSYQNIAKVIELLQKLKVKIRVQKVDDGGVVKYAIIGGAESLEWIPLDSVNKELGELLEGLCDGVTYSLDDPMKGFNITIVGHDVKKLEKIVKWKSVDKMSKTDIVEFGLTIKDSMVDTGDLENKIVYVHERQPSTNSLSLTKQFGLKHFHVQQFIFKGIEMYPSILTHIEIGLYTYNGGKGATTTATYYELDEHAYTHFLESMGTPKTFNMRVYRDNIKREYYDGFIRLKELTYTVGFEEREIRNLLANRTLQTSELMTKIGDFAKAYHPGTNVVKVMRVLFNVTNRVTGIHAITRDAKSNRNVLDSTTQTQLLIHEANIVGALKTFKADQKKPLGKQLVSLLSNVFDTTSKDVMKMLKDYESDHLIKELS